MQLLHKFRLFTFLLFIGCLSVYGQDNGHIAGIVKAVETERGLPGVFVELTELEMVNETDEKGAFQFLNVPAGTYSLAFMAPGYGRTVLLNVIVYGGQTWYDQIYIQKSKQEGEQFYIGGIEVTAEKELLPENISTTTQITSGEIEHIQASSLGDILELIPGQEFSNPGMENVKQIGLRQTSTSDEADRNASFGTQILMDGVPVSNNANMQLDTDLNDGATYRITTNAGVDLRRIAADNIQSIEVIRGIPSAKYGDLTSGAIVVQTRSGYSPFRLKFKYNPRNTETNVSGGYGWENHSLNMNLNYARSYRDIRVDGDYFNRLSAKLSFKSHLLDRKLQWTHNLYYTQTLDEQELREGDILEVERYNRDYETRYSTDLDYMWGEKGRIQLLLSANLNRQDSHIKKIISSDIGIISTRMIPGVQEGHFVSAYTSRLWVKGRAWNLYGQLSAENQFMTGKILHRWMAGITTRYEFNNGPGREFDPRYPPRRRESQGDRPRPYDDIPGLNQTALFIEDEITGHLWGDFSLQLGLRLDLFGFNGFGGDSFLKTDHGTLLNPRINFVYYLSANNQLRLGYGRTAKSPSLSMIYPNPVYFDVVDSVYYDPHDVDNRLAIVNTHIYDRTNNDIKASVRDKFEASFDQKIGPVGLSLTGFYERSHNGFELGGYNPVGLDRYFYPQWPQSSPALPKDTLVLNYRTPINSVETEAKGIELAITTKRLEPLNSTIRIDAAYHYSDSWWQNNYFEHASNLRYDPNLNQKVIPFWNPTSRRSDKLIIHYRFDTIFKPLGLWFTLNIQQIAMDRDQYTGLDDSLAVGYVDDAGHEIFIPENERGDQKYSAMRRTYSDYNYITESKPGLWLINLRVSKELWPGSEVSFFVNNLLNSRPLYQRARVPSGAVSYIRRNPEIFYGIEFSTVLDDLFDYAGRFY